MRRGDDHRVAQAAVHKLRGGAKTGHVRFLRPGKFKLFFVNVGAYRPDTLAELHEFGLFVAEDAKQAKKQALSRLLSGAAHQHKDNLKDVDNCLLLDKVGEGYLHLTPMAEGQLDRPAWQGYQPI